MHAVKTVTPDSEHETNLQIWLLGKSILEHARTHGMYNPNLNYGVQEKKLLSFISKESKWPSNLMNTIVLVRHGIVYEMEQLSLKKQKKRAAKKILKTLANLPTDRLEKMVDELDDKTEDRDVTIVRSIRLISTVIPDLKLRESFQSSLLKIVLQQQKTNSIYSDEENSLYTKYLPISKVSEMLDLYSNKMISIARLPSNYKDISNFEEDIDGCFLLVEGTTDATFNGEEDYHRPTVQSYLERPGFLDHQP